MRDLTRLRERLLQLDGRGYPAYKGIRGEYEVEPGWLIAIEHVQGDPFADPSRVRAVLGPAVSELPDWARSTRGRRVACADYLGRALQRGLERASRQDGSGRSGELASLRPGQQVLARTNVEVAPNGAVTARLQAGLPAQGRRILGRSAADLLCGALPDALEDALAFAACDPTALRQHLETVEDAQALRDQLSDLGLVAFVGDGALLPRRSGVDDRPLGEGAVPFETPDALRVTLEAPNAGPVTGMGVPTGVTLIVGGGFHGKSTLLRALERGVYDHVPGDGRERVVTIAEATKVRAEDGRSVVGVDIRNFIGDLPGGQPTDAFSTPNASGSTSQAAAVVEALEAGARCLLVDEDTCATNFMIRDARMQALVADEHEPITPYVDRARQLLAEGVSTVLVVGGAGDYFDVADTVIAMRDYRPLCVTERARQVAAELPTRRRTGGAGPWRAPDQRAVDPASIDPSKGRRQRSIKVLPSRRVLFGREEVDASALEQVVETAQLRAIAHALAWARGRHLTGGRPLGVELRALMDALDAGDLSRVEADRPSGRLAAFRRCELGAFLGRLRTLRTRSVPEA